MKVGDLVTLSEAALDLAPLWRYRDRVRAGQVVGMITEVHDNGPIMAQYFKGSKYEVFWFDPKLQNRTPPLKRQTWYPRCVWKRTDLKKYRPPGKK